MLKFVVFVAFVSVAFGGSVPTKDQLRNAVQLAGYSVPSNFDAKYQAFVNSFNWVNQKMGYQTIKDMGEMAMFIAQCLHETGGFNHLGELNPLPEYGTYYGRGYIQLSGDYNYRACSQDLYGNDDLVNNPNRVLQSEDESWRTAFWYWGRNCHWGPDVAARNFDGTTSNCIRPAIPHHESRQKCYQAARQAFGV